MRSFRENEECGIYWNEESMNDEESVMHVESMRLWNLSECRTSSERDEKSVRMRDSARIRTPSVRTIYFFDKGENLADVENLR